MKMDSCDNAPRYISADTVPVMAAATELFIGVLSDLAWNTSTKPNKRNTLLAKVRESASRNHARLPHVTASAHSTVT